MSLAFESIAQIGERLRAGELSATELTESMLERIERLNPVLNAYVTVTAELALAQAKQADTELSQGHDRGALHGVPIAIKDLFATQGIRTTCGSQLFEDWIPAYDATVVVKMRDAGAVPLGKTGLHELAYGTNSINPFFGAITNPWATDHDPGGSSGGSASAVAAGLAFAAIGSDTGCSIRQPAHCCGVVGHKPTFGLVSKSGALPLVWSMDHVGPLTRTVTDAAIVLEAISGHDPSDPYSRPDAVNSSFVPSGTSLAGTRIGVIRQHFFDGHQDVIQAVEAALETLRSEGAELVELDAPDVEDAFDAAKATFAEAAVIHSEDYQHRPHAFSDEVRAKIESGFDMKATRYAEAQHFRRGFIARMEQLMSQVDVVVAPTATMAASPIERRPQGESHHAWKNCGIFDFTGQPSISVPCGFTPGGLPVGLMISARLDQDRRVLEFAHAYEQVAPWRDNVPPVGG